MLVLSRRIGERLRIGSDVEVVVLDVRGRDVRLGVTAPPDVAVHREEIYLRIKQANQAAALAKRDMASLAAAAREFRSRAAKPLTAMDGSPCQPTPTR